MVLTLTLNFGISGIQSLRLLFGCYYFCLHMELTAILHRFSVPHDRLFLDALERDLKREKMGHEPTTVPRGEPALSFTFDPKQSLYDQFLNQNLKRLHDEDLDNFDHRVPIGTASSIVATASNAGLNNSIVSPADVLRRRADQAYTNGTDGTVKPDPAEEESAQRSALNNLPFFSMFSLFEGSPTYKQRRKKTTKARRPARLASTTMSSTYEQPPTPPYHAEAAGYPSALVTADAHNQFQDAQGQHPSSIALMPAHPSLAQAPALQSYGLTSNFAADEREGGAYHPRLSHSPSSVSPPIGLNANLNLAVNPSNPGVIGVTSQKKAYLCPLYSCRLAFRRLDCLKRHIRAHRLEKPYACDRCEKRFSRPELLQQHALVHTHPEGVMATTFVDQTEEDGMEFDVGQAHVLQDIPATQAYEDDNDPVYPRPPRSAGAASDGSGHYFASNTPPFATHPIMHSTSTETSPYVETPQGSGWAQVRGRPTVGIPSGSNHPQLHLDVYSAAAEAFGPTASTPLSINLHATGAYAQGGHIHPASAPAQKLAFDHTALYPHPPPTATQAYAVGPRHRSATPSMGRASLDGAGMQQSGSRPQTAVSNASGSINLGNASYNSQFAYTIDEAGAALAHPSSRGSPHSGVYGMPMPGPQEQQQQFIPSPHGSYHSGHSNSPPHSLIAGHSNGSMGYMAGTFTTGMEGYSVSQYASSLHPFVQENTAEVPAALHDSPEDLHLAAAAQTIAPRYLQGGLGPASFHGSDDGSPKVYQYQLRSSGDFDGFSAYPTQMGGAQVTPHGQQLSGYHYEQQQQVAL